MQVTSLPGVSPKAHARELQPHERAEKAMHCLQELNRIGGDPATRKKREAVVANLKNEFKFTEEQVSTWIRMMRDGASYGVKCEIEQMFYLRPIQ